jgi:hypothetical protein
MGNGAAGSCREPLAFVVPFSKHTREAFDDGRKCVEVFGEKQRSEAHVVKSQND